MFKITAIVALVILSYVSFFVFGSHGIYSFVVWLGCHLYFFSALEASLEKQFRDGRFERRDSSILLQLLCDFFGWESNAHCKCCKFKIQDFDTQEAHYLSEALLLAIRKKNLRELKPLPLTIDGNVDNSDEYDNTGNSNHTLSLTRDNESSEYNNDEAPYKYESGHTHVEKSVAEDTLSTLSSTPNLISYQVAHPIRSNSKINITEEQTMIHHLLECANDEPKSPYLSEWKLVQHRHDIKVWTGSVKDSPWMRIRGKMRCVATPAELLSLLIDDSRISEYDRLFDSMRMVERKDDRTCVRWSSYRALWPARPRDFVIKSTWEEFADGTVVIATKSVTHPDCPEIPTFERGKMIMCGFVISPREIVPGMETEPENSNVSINSESILSDSDNEDERKGKVRFSIDGTVHGSEVTMFSHTDLGGNLPATIVNRICMKPAYRVLRKIQKFAAAGKIATSAKSPAHKLQHRTKSEELLNSLLENSLLDGPGGHVRQSVNEHQNEGVIVRPKLSHAFAAAEARRIIALLERMASEKEDWVKLGSKATLGDMALYKWPIPHTRRVRLGASATVRAAPGELLGLLLESAAMLGPDYVVDEQQSVERLSSSVGTQEAAIDDGSLDTSIIWFSCTHRRQRMRRDFVVLRCFKPFLEDKEGGGMISYASIDHPAYPPTQAYVRGKIEMCGFVILPQGMKRKDIRMKRDLKEQATSPVVGMGKAFKSIVDVVRAPWSPKQQPITAAPIPSVSEVYFFTHLSFSDNLPALEDVQASKYLLGPLHILRELRRVVDRTIEYSNSNFAKSSLNDGDSGLKATSPDSPESSNGANVEVNKAREEALRDLLVLASDGECMDGPQANWKLVRDGGDKGVRLWSCEQEGSAWSMIRTRTKIEGAPSNILKLLLDEGRISEYDDMFDSIEMLVKVDDNAMFKRTAYKPVWPTAPRDFCMLSSWGELEDGSAYLVNRSMEHSSCPERVGFVRGFLVIVGFLMVPLPVPESGCTLTMVVHTELGGNLPASIINRISIGAPEKVTRKIQKIFEVGG